MDSARYTTPTNRLVVKGADLTGCRVWATFSQGRLHRVTVELSDGVETEDGWEFDVRLTQGQTASFRQGRPVDVQVNFIDASGYRAATEVKQTGFGPQLMDRKVSWSA